MIRRFKWVCFVIAQGTCSPKTEAIPLKKTVSPQKIFFPFYLVNNFADNKFEQVKKPSSSNLPDIEQSPFSCLARSETRMPSSNSNGSFKHLDFSIPGLF